MPHMKVSFLDNSSEKKDPLGLDLIILSERPIIMKALIVVPHDVFIKFVTRFQFMGTYK